MLVPCEQVEEQRHRLNSYTIHTRRLTRFQISKSINSSGVCVCVCDRPCALLTSLPLLGHASVRPHALTGYIISQPYDG